MSKWLLWDSSGETYELACRHWAGQTVMGLLWEASSSDTAALSRSHKEGTLRLANLKQALEKTWAEKHALRVRVVEDMGRALNLGLKNLASTPTVSWLAMCTWASLAHIPSSSHSLRKWAVSVPPGLVRLGCDWNQLKVFIHSRLQPLWSYYRGLTPCTLLNGTIVSSWGPWASWSACQLSGPTAPS